jgi:subtilisin family serine protease
MLLKVKPLFLLFSAHAVAVSAAGGIAAQASAAPGYFRDRGYVLEGTRLDPLERQSTDRLAGEPVRTDRLMSPPLMAAGVLSAVRISREDGRVFEAYVGRDALVQLDGGEEELARLGLQGELINRDARLWKVRREGVDGLELAAELSRDSMAEYISMAVPDYYLERKLAAIDVPPNDPIYPGQWFFEKLGVEEAWSYSTGSSDVTVVVVDNGCDLAHPDLVRKLDPGRDEIDDDDDPSYDPAERGNEHGTACAGLIAAETDNELGVAGVCPECRVRCVRLIGGFVPISADVRAFDFAKNNGAAVVSNSWGFVDAIPAPGPLAAAIADVTENGRDGLGSIVVFAAGNENREILDDEVAALPNVIAVGALTIFDEATSFSNFGGAVDVTSPVGTITTDVSGSEGGDPGDYTTSFGGTSSACPLVAGIAALLVSAKPDATGREVEAAIIEATRRAPFAEPDGNGHDPLYGYGIASAPRAMRKLLGLNEPGPDAGVPSDTGIVAESDAGVNEADANVTMPVEPAEDEGCTSAAVGGSDRELLFALFAGFIFSLLRLRAPRRV